MGKVKEYYYEKECKDIEEAIAFANDSPYPLPEELLENVYNEEA